MIGITLGESMGIGAEITAKSLKDITRAPHIIYGDRQHLEKACDDLGIHMPRSLTFCQVDCHARAPEDLKQRGQYVLDQLDAAISDALAQKVSGLLTAPIDKSIVAKVLPNFDGHTGYLEKKTQSPMAIMLMQNNDFRIVVGTQHIPLRQVSQDFNEAYFLNLLEHLVPAYQKYFNVDKPKMAVLGINPHAGEVDPDAEEKCWLSPCIQRCHSQGMLMFGPFSADAFFPSARDKNWDIIISPYHDQALVAAKYNGLDQVANITLGLPFLRTSPGHGVAYDIAGQNKADPSSFQNAFDVIVKALR